MKFTECLNDLYNYFFLADPANLSRFKSENNLADNLISEFTQNQSGDIVVEQGVLIPLSGIENYPYIISFQVNNDRSIFNEKQVDLQFKKTGYILEVISKELYLMTVPYLKQWTKNQGIKSLQSNGIKPKIDLENGSYTLEILGGETYQESGWEPTLEFILKKNISNTKFSVEDVGFSFLIKSKEY